MDRGICEDSTFYVKSYNINLRGLWKINSALMVQVPTKKTAEKFSWKANRYTEVEF